MTKDELVEKLSIILHQQARVQGYTCAAIGEAGYMRMYRMTKTQLQNEIDRLQGKKSLDELPKDHVCFIVNSF